MIRSSTMGSATASSAVNDDFLTKSAPHWKRFVLKLKWVGQVALLKYKAIAIFGRTTYHSLFGGAGVMPQLRPRLIKGDGVGGPMSPESKGKHEGIDPLDCLHPNTKMKNRGNATEKWWTCIGCGRRWVRIAANAQPASTFTSFGPHLGMMYEDVLDQYPDYCDSLVAEHANESRANLLYASEEIDHFTSWINWQRAEDKGKGKGKGF